MATVYLININNNVRSHTYVTQYKNVLIPVIRIGFSRSEDDEFGATLLPQTPLHP
jgi:hypothetical protein